MVKFKKRVARHKISGFLKNVPLILFFHGIDKNDFYKILNHFLITEKSNLLKTEKKSKALQCKDLDFLQKRNDSIPEIEKRIALQGLTVKSIKNNYAKKDLEQFFVLENFQQNNIHNVSWKQKDPQLSKKAGISNYTAKTQQSCVIDNLCENSDDQFNSFNKSSFVDSLNNLQENNSSTHLRAAEVYPEKASASALFQGKILCLGFKNPSFLGLLESFVKNRNNHLHLLGGIYENNIIDPITVKRLASICQNGPTYPLCLNVLKSCNNRLIGSVSSLLDFSYLQAPQAKLICLMQILHQYKIQGTSA